MTKYLIGLMSFLSVPIFAQDSSSIDLEGVTVTANIIKTEIKKTGRNVSIIDRKTIESSPVKTLDGVLQYALNVDVRSRSAFGVQADISIRGGHYDQTLILVDGVKVNDPQTGHHSLNIPVPFSSIERIEVLQGGASRVFGPSAFAGVINIITKKSERNAGGAMASFGQYGALNLGASATIVRFPSKAPAVKNKENPISISANFEFSKNDGYIPNTAFNKRVFASNLEKVYKKGSIDFGLGSMSNHFGASNFYHPKFFNQYEEVDAKLFTSTWKHNFSNKLTGFLLANFRQHHDLYDFDNYRNTGKINSVNFHKTSVFDIEWKFKSINRLGNSAFGIEYRNENVLSNRLGDNISIPIEVIGYSDVFYSKSKSRDNASAFLEHSKNWNKLNVSAGTLFNYNSQFGLSAYPGIDISYSLTEKFNLYSTINRSLRFPTFTELYLNASTVKADPNLKPEKAVTSEIGLKTHSKYYSGTLTVFYRKTNDAIDKVKRPELPVPTMENIDNINMLGFEMGSTFLIERLAKPFKQLTINYAYLSADRKEIGFQSFYTLNYLKHKLSTGLLTEPFKNFTWNAWYIYKFRQGNYQWDATSPIESYKPIHLVDTRLSYKWNKIKFNFDVTNLFDVKYYEFGFVQLPGRWLSVGINANF